MSLRNCITLFFFQVFALIFSSVASAETWMAGSVSIESIEGEMILERVGDASELKIVELPQYASGLLRVRTVADSAVFLRTSNQISIYNSGPGYFAIERFDQMLGGAGEPDLTDGELGQSRMILNMREGLLIVDGRRLNAESQLIVEIPLGRMSVKKGWWLMQIFQNERTQIYNYSIECAAGSLRFTDRQGESYVLTRGQRLSGAGSSVRPSIEVAETTAEGRELFERFAERAESPRASELSWESFRQEMKPMAKLSRLVEPVVSSEPKAVSSKRPLVIEYAPQSPPVTPFRAVIRPPSAYQADLF